jgi:hypothetical protein
MKTKTFVLFASIILVGSGVGAGEAGSADLYGAALSDGLDVTPIEQILNKPDEWSGQRVKVEGEVSGVCTTQGCWMDLTSADDVTVRIKVDDGVIVFPQAAVGRLAQAEGEVEILEMNLEKYTEWLEHVAEEEGREFNPEEIGEPPYRIVRIRGLGAEISG